MKRLLSTLGLALGLTLAVPLSAMAMGGGGQNTNPQACPDGKMVVNVTYTVTNDPDSAYGGYNWATDTLNRHLQVFQTGDNLYCAQVSDNGSFVTTGAGDPAGKGATLDAGVTGVINGGYNTGNYTSSFSPVFATKGNLGSFDVSVRPSISSYTPDWAGSQPYWSWYYHTAQNGNWTNAYNVSSTDGGDITN